MLKLNKVSQRKISSQNPYLQYLHTFKDIFHQPNELSDLHDGVILSELFQLIKGFKLIGEFDENPRTFSHKFCNLKVLFQSIERYWNENLDKEIQSEDIDKIEMAYNRSLSQIEKFLQLFVKTAVNSQNKHPFIEKMLDTSEPTQELLKKVIEKTINSSNKQSPRKQKEKRMIDKLIELDHQNQKLQQFISIICDQTLQFQLKHKSLTQLLNQKNEEISKLQNAFQDYNLTPRKSNIQKVPETSDRKSYEIQYLRTQIADLKNLIHDYQNQRQKFDEKLQLLETTKAQLQLSQSIIQSNQSIIDKIQSTQNNLNQSKAELMSKNNLISILRVQLQKSKANVLQLQKRQLNLRSELQRKNLLISQLTLRMEKSVPKEPQNRHNLFLQFPEIINTEANAYMQINKALRQQLERNRTSLVKIVAEQEKATSEIERLKKYEGENKKLKQMIIQEKSNKGQQIELLVNALYHLRKQVKQTNPQIHKVLQPKNT